MVHKSSFIGGFTVQPLLVVLRSLTVSLTGVWRGSSDPCHPVGDGFGGLGIGRANFPVLWFPFL